MASAELAVKISPTNTPAERVMIDVNGTTISMAATDVAVMIIDKLLRTTRPNAGAPLPACAGPDYGTPPRIGQLWTSQGGIYAGTVRGEAGEPDCYLIVATPEQTSIGWKAALEWAPTLWLEGFRDYTLPRRKEQAILFGNVPELFAKECYWSSEEYAGYAHYAWYQSFFYGTQFNDHKTNELRARAVRRVPIQ